MQISIQSVIDNEADKEKIATAMLKNYENCKNFFSDEDEPLEIFDAINKDFVIADICTDYDLYKSWADRSIILKINDSYFSWNYGMDARYGDWDFYECKKVIPVKKTVIDVNFIPVEESCMTEETEIYKKIFHTGL